MPSTRAPFPCLFAGAKGLNPKGLYRNPRYAAAIRQIFIERPGSFCGHPYHLVLEFWSHRRPMPSYQYPWHCTWMTHNVLCALLEEIFEVVPGFTMAQTFFVLRPRRTSPEDD